MKIYITKLELAINPFMKLINGYFYILLPNDYMQFISISI